MPLTLAAMSVSPVLKSMLTKHLSETASEQLTYSGRLQVQPMWMSVLLTVVFLIANQQIARVGSSVPVNGNPESDQFFNHSLKYISMWLSKAGEGPWLTTMCTVFLGEHPWPPPHNPSPPPQLSYLSQICIIGL